jgi:hypothetical protein
MQKEVNGEELFPRDQKDKERGVLVTYCREIIGDCTAPIGPAITYIYIGGIQITSLGAVA